MAKLELAQFVGMLGGALIALIIYQLFSARNQCSSSERCSFQAANLDRKL